MTHHDHDGCGDFQATRAHLLRRAAGQTVQLPGAAIDDAKWEAAFSGPGRSRRRFLGESMGVMLAVAGMSMMDPFHLIERARAAAASDPNAPILVLVYLNGGNDGLNTLIPLEGANRSVYDQRRTRLAIPATSALPIAGVSGLGWHPAATGLRDLFDAGKLGVLPAVDYPDSSLSHFTSQHYWRSGQVGSRETTGWLGRYLDIVGAPDNPLQGIAVDWSTDGVLNSASAPTSAIVSPELFAFDSPAASTNAGMLPAYAQMGVGASYPALQAAAKEANDAVQVRKSLDTVTSTTLGAGYPATDTGSRLSQLARMIDANLGVRVATVTVAGSFDTHGGQADRHTRLLTDLGSSLKAWQGDLEARGLADRVVTLVWSEFGRRVDDNASGGTDHGVGGLLFTLGTKVVPGLRAAPWDLSNVAAANGNIPAAVDFRDVYAGLIEQHLQIGATDVLPGYAGTPLALVA